ncbi:nurim-like [Pristis pectinata]|uniref:nurim-like n=1 Tax=Pristis pectinata TaxID=685728 RepID=UPI00223E7B05|nr:nurim-like [Pristis pectinata]
MAVLQSAALACVSLANFIFVSWSTVQFMAFVSLRQIYRDGGRPGATADPQTDAHERMDWGSALGDREVLLTLLFNLALLMFFILQHSLMATETVKNWTLAAFGVLQRSLYVFCTAASLQLLMGYWKPIQTAPLLWNVCREPYATWFPLICFIVHIIAWLIIFSIVLIFDYAELMGLKQVYYHCLALGDPMELKSQRAQRLYSHLRHPVFLEFLVILWLVPSLSLDRLLLSATFTLYLICGHGLDQQDYHYLRSQLNKKFEIFSREEAAYAHPANRNGMGEHQE